MKNPILMWSIKDVIDVVERRRNERKKGQTIIAICGRPGMGKSTLAWKLCKQDSKRKTEKIKRFKPRRDIIYDVDMLIKAVDDRERSIFVDEAIYVGFKRNWQNKRQIDLGQILNSHRDHRNLIILCIPSFWDLDRTLRKLCNMRIDIFIQKQNWAKAVIHIPNQSQYSEDNWDAYNNERLERRVILGRKNPKYHILSTYAGYLKYKPMIESEEKKYQEIKDSKRNQIWSAKEKAEQGNHEPTPYENFLTQLKERKLTREDIMNTAPLLGLKYSALIGRLNKDLRDQGEKTVSHLVLPRGVEKNSIKDNPNQNPKNSIDFLISS